MMDSIIQEKLNTFFTQFREIQYKKGEIIIRAEDAPPGIFYLKEGIVRKYAISKKGEEVVINMFKPISFFPMSYVFHTTMNHYYYEAMSDVTVFRAPKDKVYEFIKQEPDVLFDLMKRIYRGLEGIEKRITYLMSGDAYARLLTELIIQSRRFGTVKNNTIEMKISEKDLAAESGMTRETVSREMKILKDKGLVRLDKNMLHIPDIGKLEEALGEDY